MKGGLFEALSARDTDKESNLNSRALVSLDSPFVAWVQVMSTSLSGSFQLENADKFESASTSASALARVPLAVITMCDFFTSREKRGISVGWHLN